MNVKRIVVIGILILVFSVFPIKGNNKIIALNENGRTLYVGGRGPNNYTHIQDAINDANDGDTIFVYDDSSPYYENVIIDKSIKLIGENKETTVIDGRKKGFVIRIRAKNVTVSNFKIRNGGFYDIPEKGGIGIFSDYTKILNNIITSNGYYGIQIYSNHNLIERNKIYSHAWWGLIFDKSSKNIVRNNTICHSKGGLGLMLSCNNNLIENNVIRSIEHAIDIDDSNENIVIRNKIFNVADGIIISSVFSNATNNYIAYNNISNCYRTGITVDGMYNKIERNIISKCGDGIYGGIDIFSSYNVISNNTFLKSGIIIHAFPNIISNNSVNGKPLIYIEDSKNIELNGTIAGQIILANCSKIKLTNLCINHTCIGLQLFASSYCYIFNNNFSENGIGIKCEGNYNLIINNKIEKNEWQGIVCDDSFNHIERNKIISNKFEGIYVAGNNVVAWNNISYNSCGLRLCGDNNLVENNSVYYNELDGIYLEYSCSNIIRKNKFVNNSFGITLEMNCKNNIIVKNEFVNDGILYIWWIGKKMGHNEIYDNKVNGKPLIYMEGEKNRCVENAGQIILVNCENIIIKNQNISNTSIGVLVYDSTNCNFSGNQISGKEAGLSIIASKKIFIIDNVISSRWIGLSIYNSFENIISKNVIKNSMVGLSIDSSKNNIFSYNNILQNDFGLSMEQSYFNKSYRNSFIENGNATFIIYSNFNKFLKNNFIKNGKDVVFCSIHNLWLRNYWDNWHIFLPKPIIGRFGRMPVLPWLNFDWIPSLKPWR